MRRRPPPFKAMPAFATANHASRAAASKGNLRLHRGGPQSKAAPIIRDRSGAVPGFVAAP